MRRLIGCLVLVGGVAGLGYVASTDHAKRIQAAIADDARIVVSEGIEPLQLRVSGRDVSVVGRVVDPTQRALIQTVLENIDGVRVVDISGLETLPLVSPFSMRFFIADGVVNVAGAVPTLDAIALFPAGSDLTLAAGVPGGDWVTLAAQTPNVVAQLQSGAALLTDRTLMIQGVARTPDDRAAILASLGPLPDGYILDDDISFQDDGAPLSLNLTLADGSITALGKFPSDMPLSDVTDQFDQIAVARIDQATIPAADPNWPDMARITMEALGQLIDGRVVIKGASVMVTGRGNPSGKTEAEALLAALPDTYAVTTDITLWDDGAPLQMAMDWDGSQATANGKFPVDFSPRGPAGTAVVNNARASFLPDPDGTFTTNANAGVTALGLMATGRVEVTKDAIVLTGTAASPQVDVVLDSVFAGVAPNTEITRTITYLDDGSPAAWTLRYAAATGAQVEGRLPVGLSRDDIATTLGVAKIDGSPATALEDENTGTSLETLTIAARYLPEVEQMEYARDGDGSALDLILSPGVDIDLVATDLAQTLPADVAFSLSSMDVLPPDGTKRMNRATGLNEVFTSGFWLPDLDFTVDVAGCTEASNAILNRAKINFLSGSARLDATSIRAINGLAAIARPCLDAGLRLEIGGHTDATGDPDSNDDLSFDRAAQVRAALIDRGATADVMTPVGYGQTQPIADNGTPEGRAENRRTTLAWTQP